MTEVSSDAIHISNPRWVDCEIFQSESSLDPKK